MGSSLLYWAPTLAIPRLPPSAPDQLRLGQRYNGDQQTRASYHHSYPEDIRLVLLISLYHLIILSLFPAIKGICLLIECTAKTIPTPEECSITLPTSCKKSSMPPLPSPPSPKAYKGHIIMIMQQCTPTYPSPWTVRP